MLILVSDPDGRPVEGADLELGKQMNIQQFMDPSALEDLGSIIGQVMPQKAKTDERGAYQFGGLETGTLWNLSIEKRGFIEQYRELQMLPGRENLVRVELSTGGRLEVTVVGPDGQPYDGANLQIRFPDLRRPAPVSVGMQFGGGAGADVVSHKLRTEDDGVASIEGLPAGRAELQLRTAGFLRESRDLTVTFDATAEATFRLDAGLAITGRVIDESGAPIPGAYVMHMALAGQKVMGMDLTSIIGLDMLSIGLKERGVECDEHGRFVLGGFEEGEETALIAGADGFDANRLEDVTAGSDVEIALLRSCQLTGTVVAEPGGVPIPAFAARLEKRAFLVLDRPIVSETFQDRSDGSFALEPCPRERFQLIVEAVGRAPFKKGVDLREGSVDFGLVQLKLPGAIEGIATDPGGTPVPGVAVRISKGGPMDSFMMAKFFGAEVVETDDEGRFLIDGLRDGRVRLIANKEGVCANQGLVRSRCRPVRPRAASC